MNWVVENVGASIDNQEKKNVSGAMTDASITSCKKGYNSLQVRFLFALELYQVFVHLFYALNNHKYQYHLCKAASIYGDR